MSADRTTFNSGLSRKAIHRLIALASAAVVVALILAWLHPAPVPGSPDMLIDPLSGIPAPPTNLSYSPHGNLIAIISMGSFGLAGVAWGLIDFFRKHTLLPLMIALSGTMIVIPEVFVDVMGAVYYPWRPDAVAYTILGRHMPWWIFAAWFGYGALSVFVFEVLQTNPRTKILWLLWGGACAMDVIFEECTLHLGIYHYYGNQPLVLLWQLPWWWLPCNSVGVFLASALAYRYKAVLQGWRALAMLVVTPVCVGGVYGTIAMPCWIVVNGAYPWLITQIAGLITILLGIYAFYLTLNLVLNRRPLALEALGPTHFPRAI